MRDCSLGGKQSDVFATLAKVGRLIGPGDVLSIGFGALPSQVVLTWVVEVPSTDSHTIAVRGVDEFLLRLRVQQVSIGADGCCRLAIGGSALCFGAGHTQGAAVVPTTGSGRKASQVALGGAHATAALVVAAVGTSGGAAATGATGAAEISIGVGVDTLAVAVAKSFIAEVDTLSSRATLPFRTGVVTRTAVGRANRCVHTGGVTNQFIWVLTGDIAAASRIRAFVTL